MIEAPLLVLLQYIVHMTTCTSLPNLDFAPLHSNRLVVLDLVSQVRVVVLVMCIFSSGKPQGLGILERGVNGEGDGNGDISLRASWDQGGQDPIAARRVPSK
jgi:hypothetical protein